MGLIDAIVWWSTVSSQNLKKCFSEGEGYAQSRDASYLIVIGSHACSRRLKTWSYLGRAQRTQLLIVATKLSYPNKPTSLTQPKQINPNQTTKANKHTQTDPIEINRTNIKKVVNRDSYFASSPISKISFFGFLAGEASWTHRIFKIWYSDKKKFKFV